MKIVFGADHGGYELKQALVAEFSKTAETVDCGCGGKDSCDYPDFADDACEALIEGRADFAILVCTTGEGMSMSANRFHGVRAALCTDAETARSTRAHNDANALVLGAANVSVEKALEIARAFVETPFSAGERHVRRIAKIDRAKRLAECSALAEYDPEVHAAVLAQIRQEDTEINLIASENTSSRAVRAASGSVLMNKYAEGYPAHRWYSGCLPVDAVEELARTRACALFGAEHANVQPHCGSAANMAVYLACLEPGDKILSLSLDQGGHLSHGSPVNFSGKLYKIVPYTTNRETERIDYGELEKLALAEKPRLLLSGASAYPRALDFKRIREIVDKTTAAMKAENPDSPGCIMMVDMAHIAGLVAGGAHESPVPYADFVTTTTHKTLRGPRGGLVLCKKEWAKKLDSAVFPGMQGGPLENIIAGKAVCFKEAASPEFAAYARQVVSNCKAMCETIASRGYRIVSGGTDNHLFLVDVKSSKGITGKDAAAALDAAGIVVNKNTIPFDSESPFRTSGIRIGTASVTTRGMKEEECRKIGGWIADILDDISDLSVQSRVKELAAALTAGFPVP